MASSSALGMMMSRISTDCTVIPQALVLASSTSWISRPRRSRWDSISASSCLPMASRSPVWADSDTAASKSATSSTAFWASHTIQKAMASTLTGTVSRVRVVSAEKSVTRMRWST